MSKMFVIEAVGVRLPPLYWSADSGWGDRNVATLFKEAEIAQVELPIGGRWAELAYSQLAEIEKKR
jgi:hypothetical protein